MPLQVCITSTNTVSSTEISKGYAYCLNAHPASSQHSQCNILITGETPPRACLADFGLSISIPSATGGWSTSTTGGTWFYMAPELLIPGKFGLTDSRPTQPADIYAMGMVIYEVLTGFNPFYDLNLVPAAVVTCVLAGKRPTKPSNAEGIGFGSGTWDLVQECWKTQPAKRPTTERVLQHLEHISASSAAVPPTSPSHSGTSHISTPLSIFGNRSFSDPKVLLRAWRDLASRGPTFMDHQLFATLVDNKEDRDITSTFRGKDAAVVINTIDEVSCF